jgi:hypothetical protein
MRWRIDRPYRIGDRIDLPALETWGNVVDIGLRSTRVLTLNHRMVMLPYTRGRLRLDGIQESHDGQNLGLKPIVNENLHLDSGKEDL